MSPDEVNAGNLAYELAQIRKELGVLDRMLGKSRRLGRDEIQIRAAASSLQSIYNGMEKMLLTALRLKGRSAQEGPTSHSDLLSEAMSSGIISGELHSSLRDLMAFRHFYRHSYGFMIDHELLNPLLQKIGGVVEMTAKELNVQGNSA